MPFIAVSLTVPDAPSSGASDVRRTNAVHETR
jgi:hypothetical protein